MKRNNTRTKISVFILLSIFLSIIFALSFSIFPSFIIKEIIDQKTLSIKTYQVVFVLGLIFLLCIINYYLFNINENLKFTILSGFKDKLFMHYMNIRIPVFDEMTSGNIISNFNRDIFSVESLLNSFGEYFLEIISGLISIVVLYSFNFYMGVYATILGLLICIGYYFLGIKIKYHSENERKIISKMDNTTNELLLYINQLKHFNIDFIYNKFLNVNNNYLNTKKKKYACLNIQSLYDDAILHVFTMFITLILGFYLFNNGMLSKGSIFASILLVENGIIFYKKVGAWYLSVKQHIIGYKKYKDVFMLPTEEIYSGEKLVIENDILKISNLSFKYDNDYILESININCIKGDFLYIVGPKGSGKSTLLKLIMGFYPDYNGSIEICSKNIKEISLHDLRSNIGYVSQQNSLFSDTVRFNLTNGIDSKSDYELYNALKLVGLYDKIKSLPNGLNSMISTLNETFSYGECIRIQLARVFIQKPAIIILDEVTSNIDTTKELEILEILENYRERFDCTILFVTHKHSSILNNSSIIFINYKKVVESGNYKQLMDKKEYFYNYFSEREEHIDQY